MKNLWIGAAFALSIAVFAPAAARAQYGAHAQLHNYERQSHGRWMAEREVFYGQMGPVRRTLHEARVAVDNVKHQVNHLVGNPDLQHYTRWDRRPLGMFGPHSSGAMYGGGMVQPGFGAPVVRQMPVYGGPAMNQTGGARYPTRWNANSRLFW